MVHPDAVNPRHAEARRRALLAAAAVASFAAGAAGCGAAVSLSPGDAASAADGAPVQAAVDASSRDAAADAGADVVADAAASCDDCALLLPNGTLPACTPAYLACLRDVMTRTGQGCTLACAAWGPFAPPAMDGAEA